METLLKSLHRAHVAITAAKWVKGSAEAAGLRKLTMLAGAISALDGVGAAIFGAATREWYSYRSEFVRDVAQNVTQYRVGANESLSAGQVGCYPVVWYSASQEWVYTPVPEPAVLASIVENLQFARITPRCGSDHRLVVLPDTRPTPPIEISEVGELAENLRATMPYGARSALLYGPPGSGKSVAARQVALRLGKSWLAISPEYHASSTAWEMARTLRPEILILDDVDARTLADGDDSATVLTQIEAAREHARVILLTANVLKNLRGAILRPGRVDEDPVYVGPPESREVVAEIAGDAAEQITDCAIRAKLLPAYINELRIRTLGGRDPRAQSASLETRMQTVGDR